jgi:hypothetical protein
MDYERNRLLEVNSSPDMNCETPLDRIIKPQLIYDILRLISPLPYARAPLASQLKRRIRTGQWPSAAVATATTSTSTNTGNGSSGSGTTGKDVHAAMVDKCLTKVLEGHTPRTLTQVCIGALLLGLLMK